MTEATASATASDTSASSTSSPSQCPDVQSEQSPDNLTIGAGVGGPLACLAMVLRGWAIVGKRERKRVIRNAAYGGVNAVPSDGPVDRRTGKAELVSSLILILPLFGDTL